MSDALQDKLTNKLLAFGVMVYMTVYAFESPIRYILNLAGADSLIFLRDGVLAAVLGFILVSQALGQRRMHPAFIFYFFIIALHGTVMVLNIGSWLAVIYSAKMLLSLLFGVFAAKLLFEPERRMLTFFWALWTLTVLGVFINKFDIVNFPWTGMRTIIGGVEVFINRDWTLTGYAKRAAGFTRSSINAANLLPPLALILMFNTRRIALRAAVFIGTLVALYWTTQKGPLLSLTLVGLLWSISIGRFIPLVRLWFLFLMVMVIALPLILPHYLMPEASGQFSMSSFYERAEFMWPNAWDWLKEHNAFPFGSGLGSIGGAQQVFNGDLLPDKYATDNIFVFMYVSFGVLTFIYLSWVVFHFLRIPSKANHPAPLCAAVLTYLMGYGMFLSLFEDQMASLFIGCCLAILQRESHKAHKAELEKSSIIQQRQ